jgi:hypothetical protein
MGQRSQLFSLEMTTTENVVTSYFGEQRKRTLFFPIIPGYYTRFPGCNKYQSQPITFIPFAVISGALRSTESDTRYAARLSFLIMIGFYLNLIEGLASSLALPPIALLLLSHTFTAKPPLARNQSFSSV